MSTQVTVVIVSLIVLAGYVLWLRAKAQEVLLRASTAQEQAQEGSLIARTLIVQTKDGVTLRGVLLRNHADRLTLSETLYYGPAGAETAVSGLVHIPRDNVSWYQEISLVSESSEFMDTNGARESVKSRV